MRVYAFVEAQKTDFKITMLCRVCGISTSGYYDWAGRVAAGPSAAERDDAAVLERIRVAHRTSRGRYGEPRITAQLARDGEPVNHKRVERLMAANGITGRGGRQKVRTTVRDPHAALSADLVNRRFEQAGLDTLWVGDATYIPTDEGWLYLATVIDACSRRLLGWSMTDHLRTELCLDARRQGQHRRGDLPQRPRLPVHRRRLPGGLHQPRRHPVDGHRRGQLRQRHGRVVGRVTEARTRRRRALRHARRGPRRRVRMARLVQR